MTRVREFVGSWLIVLGAYVAGGSPLSGRLGAALIADRGERLRVWRGDA
jgi:hypothetical protein